MAKKKAVAKTKKIRPPIVTIMGHVDHGKTTLLDTIRHTRVALTEHGGITQHTGAYQAEYQGKKITFIDTPGHAAFSKMRERGAEVTDIVVLVVAGTEGLKPQSIESIKHIQAAKVPFVVAINKMDLAGFSPEMVKAQLSEHGVFCEGYGGQVPALAISAQKNEGIDQLLEIILLMAELEEFPYEDKAPLEAVVIESHLDKHRGHLATIIVKKGTIKPGDIVFVGSEAIKIKALFNAAAKPALQAFPSDPIEVMGFTTLPPVGSKILDKPVEQAPEKLVARVKALKKDPVGNNEAEATVQEEEKKPTVNVIIKADTAGTLEAILSAVKQDELVVVNKGVGSVSEADIILAQSTGSGIIAFSVPITQGATNLARIERVKVQSFTVIYELIEFLEKKVLSLLEPSIYEEVLGRAEILQLFNIRETKIAGCKVISGKVGMKDAVHIRRGERVTASTKVASVKVGKVEAKRIDEGEECGLVFDPAVDLKVGDVIESYRLIEKA